MSEFFPRTVATDRLRLERLTLDAVDVFDLYAICSSDPGIDEVTEYVTWDPHETVKETRDWLVESEKRWDAGEAAEYVVRPREGEDGAGEIAGATILGVDWERDVGELGVWLRRRFWGRGYSGERAAALLAVAFDRLDLSMVAVSHLDGNEKSRRAVERYVEAHGGRYEGHLRRSRETADGTVVDEHRYTILRAEYRASRAET